MNIKRRHKEGAEVSTESLNDIMFFLLLFFLILSTLVNNAINVNLPTSKPGQQITTQPVELSVNSDHQYFINGKQVALDDLETSIQTAVKTMEKPELMLHFDSKLTVQDIVDVLQIGAKLNVKMVLGTKSPSA